jgi:hypothetical protein
MAMDKRKRGCLWAVLGLGVLLVMVGVAVVGGAGYLVYQQFGMRASIVAPEDAAHQLDQIRARFAGQSPRLHVRSAAGAAEVQGHPPLAHPPAPVTSLHVAAFDPGAHKLVQFSIPFWLLRHLPEGKIEVDGKEALSNLDTPSGRLTTADLEALGPGLLLDDQRPGGRRVIVWTE